MLQCRVVGCFAWIVAAMVATGPFDGASAQPAFPFDSELLLDVAPMRGSKRVPSLDIGSNGAAEIFLWCDTVKAQLVVAGDTITVITGPLTGQQCPADRMRADQDLLAALAQATNWRREGDALVLAGGKTIRFRLQTN
jgi:heat shock protein HslJ